MSALHDSRDEDYMQMVKDIVLQHVDLEQYAVFLYGSRAYGETSRAADIDVGILGDKPLGLNKIFELRDEIEASIVPFKVDFVDFYNADKKFKEIALKKIEIWNQPKHIKLD